MDAAQGPRIIMVASTEAALADAVVDRANKVEAVAELPMFARVETACKTASSSPQVEAGKVAAMTPLATVEKGAGEWALQVQTDTPTAEAFQWVKGVVAAPKRREEAAAKAAPPNTGIATAATAHQVA